MPAPRRLRHRNQVLGPLRATPPVARQIDPEDQRRREICPLRPISTEAGLSHKIRLCR